MMLDACIELLDFALQMGVERYDAAAER